MPRVVYLLMDQQYPEAITVLNTKLQSIPTCPCALSLLGSCHYHMKDFQRASDAYSRLVQVCPDVDEYRIYYVQSLMESEKYNEASRACSQRGWILRYTAAPQVDGSGKFDSKELKVAMRAFGFEPEEEEEIQNRAAVAPQPPKSSAVVPQYKQPPPATNFKELRNQGGESTRCVWSEAELAAHLLLQASAASSSAYPSAPDCQRKGKAMILSLSLIHI